MGSYFGSYAGEYWADYFGDVGGGPVVVDPVGPDGVAVLGWDHLAEVVETLQWQTTILKSWNGLERRVARLDAPRQSYSVPLRLDDGAARRLRSRLMFDPEGIYLLPRMSESLTVVDLSGVNVTVNATALALVDWATAGRRVALVNGNTYEEFTLQSAGGSTIELESSPDTSDFPPRVAAIAPLVHVHLEDGHEVGRHRVNAADSQLRGVALFAEDDFGTGAAAFDTLTVQGASRNILTKRPVMASGTASEKMVTGIELQDYGGARDVMAPRTVIDVARSYRFLINSDAERQWWKAFLYACRGRQVAFLMPTWGEDLRTHTNPSGVTLRVYNGDGDPEQLYYADDWFASPAHKQIQIVATDGTIYYRAVTAAANLADGTDALTIASLTATVDSISFLELVRLASDTVEIVWDGQCGTIDLPIVSVQR